MQSIFCVLILTVTKVRCIKYPMPTPNDKHYSALPNSGHASIQYGPNDQRQVVNQQYSQNGYDKYQSIGVRDVVHSVGTLLDIIQTFPKLAGGRISSDIGGDNVASQILVPSMIFPNDDDYESPMTDLTTSTALPSESEKNNVTFGDANQKIYDESKNDKDGLQAWTTLNQVDRHQCTYSDQVSFPCSGPELRPSFYKPNSVHRLRPADIQIIGALGDALVSAQGALSTDITTATHQYHGVSFATGGDQDWRSVLTIPNIIREFNPRLIGIGVSGGPSERDANPGFNVAENFAFSKDLEDQAEHLISRIKRTSNVDFREDWKIVLILIGHNDLCKLSCIHNGTLNGMDGNNNPQSAKDFAQNVKRALDVLMKGLPRTHVSLVLPPDPTLTMEAFHRPLVCHLASKVICPCVDGPSSRGRQHMLNVLDEYHQGLENMVAEGDYNRYDDFTVVVQTALQHLKLPKNPVSFFGLHRSFLPDLSYLSSDCFHPSQKLQALYAKNVWNNLLEPSGAKSSWNRFASLKCPTNDRPYLFTQKNSNLDDFDNNDEGDDVEDDGRRPFQRKVLVRRRRLRTRSASHPPPIWSRNQYQCNLL